MALKLGQKVPPFTAAASNGEFNLENYKGHYLVLYFYPKDSTPGCTCEANDFKDFEAQFAKLNAKIVGVSRDSLKSHENFAAKQGFSFPLIADTDSKVCDLFGVINEKSLFGKTALGLVRSTFLIDPEGKLIQEWRKVKVNGHVQEVLQAIQLCSNPPV